MAILKNVIPLIALLTLQILSLDILANSSATMPGESQVRQNGPELLAALNRAYTQGTKQFTIPAGIYQFPDQGQSSFVLNEFADATIQADGAVFILNKGGVILKKCRNVSIRGLTIDNDPIPFMQGTVQDINHVNRTLEIELDPSYRIPTDEQVAKGIRGNIQYFVPETRTAVPMQWDAAVRFEKLAANRFRIQLANNRLFTVADTPDVVKPGYLVAITVQTGSSGFQILESHNVVLEDVRVYASANFGIFERDGEGGNIYRRCFIGRKPDTTRLLSCGRDAFHSYRTIKGPTIEECDFAHTTDDLIAIHGFFSIVYDAPSPEKLTIAAPFGADFDLGSTLRFYDFHTTEPLGDAKILAVEKRSTSETRTLLSAIPREWAKKSCRIRGFPGESELLDVTLDKPVHVNPETIVSSGEKQGRGVIIRHNYLHDNLSRGILMKASDSLIAGNKIERLGYSGIAIVPESYYLEGDFVQNVQITQNQLADCNLVSYNDRFMEPFLGAIQISNWFGKRLFNPPMIHGYQQNKNIIIKDNHITRPAVFGLFIANCNDVKIIGNIIDTPHTRSSWMKHLNLRAMIQGVGAPEPAEQKYVSFLSEPYAANLILSSNTIEMYNNQTLNQHSSLVDWGIGPWVKNITQK